MKTVITTCLAFFIVFGSAYAQNDSLLVSTSSTFQTPGSGSSLGQILLSSNPSNRTLQILPARTGDGDVLNGYVFDVAYTNTGGSSNGFLFRSGTANRLIINESGNVGIGHSYPVEKFQIGNRWTFHDGGHKIIGYNYDYNSGNKRIFQDEVSLMRFTDYGDIRFEHAVSDTANSTITDWANSLTLKNDGRVGMGTESPSSNLHLKESVTGAPTLLIQRKGYVGGAGGESGAELGSLLFKNDHSNDYGAMIKGVIGTNGWASAGALDFYTSSTSGYQFAMRINNDGKIGIGTTSPDQALTVKGKIHSEEIIVDLNVPGPDYVFQEDYDLPTLSEIEAFIKANKHLPEVPSAKEMEANGISLGEMNMLLLKKIEELTLINIAQQKEIDGLKEDQINSEQGNNIQLELIKELITRIENLEAEK